MRTCLRTDARSLALGWLAHLLLAILSLATACTGSAPVEGPFEPTPLADRLLADETGELIARALEEHTPTREEMALVAGFWVAMYATAHTGRFAPEIAGSTMFDDLAELPRRWPSLFRTPDVGAMPMGLVDETTTVFSCTESCEPSFDPALALLGSLALPAVFEGVGRAFGSDLAVILSLLNDLYGTAGAGVPYGEATAGRFGDELVSSVLGLVATAFGLATSLTGVLIGAMFALVATMLAVRAMLERGRAFARVVRACREWQAANCAIECLPECAAGDLCVRCAGEARCAAPGTTCCEGRSTSMLCAAPTMCIVCRGTPMCLEGTSRNVCCTDEGMLSSCADGEVCLTCEGGNTGCVPRGSTCCRSGACFADSSCLVCSGNPVCVPNDRAYTCCEGEMFACPVGATCEPGGFCS